ncbi:hypothetical protein BSQ79_18330 [Serratia marcescens]|uniref:restriction endonuclease subunit S n=1 Tax=Serratia marcescens TaxID=615 RepID=UPI00093A57AD|nr:restriction endonuclease subunit S [Serratia marcescens]MDU7860953.1 restriction endonuclease subunit S [Serratia marcescens]OKP17347.1 hypothetical protein BSQ79_18330 [Serratia marcescens]
MVDLMVSEQQPGTAEKGVPAGFKLTEVGVIPQDWECKYLGELGDIVRGGSPRPAGDPKYFEGDFIPWLTVASLTTIPDAQQVVMTTSSMLTELGSKHSRTLEKGTLIISNSGATLGVAKLLGIKCCANDGVAAIINQRIGNKSFLIHYINTITKSLHDKIATGNGQPNLNTDLIRLIPVPFPNEQEQEKIADTLSNCDNFILKLEQLIAKKQAIKTATMQQLLTGKIRLPQFALRDDGAVKGYKKSELGDIPEDWKISKIGELSHVDPENLPSSTPPNYEFDYISLEQIDRGVLLGTTRLVFSDAPSRARRLLRCNDVMVSTVRPNLKSHYLVDHEVSDLICSTGFSVIRCDIGQLHPQFLYQHLFAASINEQIDMLISGSNYPAINSDNVKGLVVPICSLPEQTAIAAILSDMDKEIQTLQQRLDKTRQLKQGMMQELLTGKTRLK